VSPFPRVASAQAPVEATDSVDGPAPDRIDLDGTPVVGVPGLVTVHRDGLPAAGVTVRVVHRPGLGGEREAAIGITDGLGRVRWTPELPGVSALRAGDDPLWVVVGAESPWTGGTIGAVVLFVLLLGTLWFGTTPPPEWKPRHAPPPRPGD
jgi:hypothetical protein